MKVLLFNSIHQAHGTLTEITKWEQLLSDKPKEKAPLYGAFLSSDNRRKREYITKRVSITIDIDEIFGTDDQQLEIIEKIKHYLLANFNSFLVHHTHSSKKDNRRIRILIPTPAIEPKKYSEYVYVLCMDMVEQLELKNKLKIDKKSFEPQQLMYFAPENADRLAVAGGKNDLQLFEYLFEKITIPRLAKKAPEKKQGRVLKNRTGGGFYAWLNEKGLCYFLDKYFTEDYKFRKQLPNGEYEYKDLNSKKSAGVRVSANQQVLTTWHSGDIYTKEGNGARANNIYAVLKAKGIVDDIFYMEYMRERK